MPLGKGVRYRMGPNGVRLAFRGNRLVEAKNMETGATHDSAEFAADRKRKKAEMHADMNRRMRG